MNRSPQIVNWTGVNVRLRELKIKNFRKLDDLTVTFPKGLSVIVGENNTGTHLVSISGAAPVLPVSTV
jgi:hypothetical protein